MKGPVSQSMSVKRAQVEFHNVASLGEPERAAAVYADENIRRGSILRNHETFIGPMTPFLEIGANAGHTSYMLANEFGAQGFALDLSADSLRHGIALQDRWGLAHAPVRMAGDALHLPFQDNSLRAVLAFQMLSQFLDIESVFVEVKRVLAPGGLFIFAEEPLRRLLSLRLYRCPYYENMKWWERKLFDWGMLGYLVRDVIGAHQEESFGIRQNHSMYLKDWHTLIGRHFDPFETDLFLPERGWGERVAKKMCRRLSRRQFDWAGATLLGGTLAAVCRKPGPSGGPAFQLERFESLLECPDCRGPLARTVNETLACTACSYQAPLEGGVYNLLPSASRNELYPGPRPDIIDFSQPGHEALLGAGWHELEGHFGNRYRWIDEQASLRLTNVRGGRQVLRVRGFVPEPALAVQGTVRVTTRVNGAAAGDWRLDRTGLFIVETEVAEAPSYEVELSATPRWMPPIDDRMLSVNFSSIRLVPLEDN
ncbi:MAG: methyltransferase domain-containing protein [Acidobacteria bacterium]|nr:methyltransferase domain-containing protein [Acidobacteriota bacterium]